jgi:Cytochrome C oxidase, cbb3-type, subunit III
MQNLSTPRRLLLTSMSLLITLSIAACGGGGGGSNENETHASGVSDDGPVTALNTTPTAPPTTVVTTPVTSPTATTTPTTSPTTVVNPQVVASGGTLGKTLYNQHCVSCHGFSKTAATVRANTMGAIANNTGNMGQFSGTITQAMVNDMATYLANPTVF